MQKMHLKEKYNKEVAPALIKEFDVKNKMAAPRVEKVIVNIGTNQVSRDKAKFQQLKEDVAKITGQAPSVRQARVSVAGFNVREGMPVGLKVTLRGVRMYDFLSRLFSIVLPRLRDFRGVSGKAFDKVGNYTLGIREHSVFPEIDIAKSGSFGMEVTIVTNTKSPQVSKKLLSLMGMPFEKDEQEELKGKN